MPRKTYLRSTPTIPLVYEEELKQFMGLEHVAIDTNNFDGEVNFSLLIGLLLGAAPGVWNAAAEKNFSRYKGVLSTISTDGSIPEVLSELVFLMANL